jgi:putative peptidoglycan lipid II flippase
MQNMHKDSHHSIFQSAKRFFGGTVLSRISGLLRDVAMAFAFGTQETVAAFLVAFRFAHLLRRLFGEGALQTAFIPHFETLRKESHEHANRFFCNLAAVLTIGLTGLIVLVMLILGTLLLFMDMSAGNQEIMALTFLLMPSLLFICLFGLNASLLQCEKSYFIPGVAPVAFNLVWIIGVFCIWNLPSASAMSWLSGWVIFACVCQWLMTIPQILSALRSSGITNPFKNIDFFSIDVRRIYKPLLLGIVGVSATQINSALDAVFARYASLEGPAMLWYALRIQQLPLALFGVAIAGALLPPLSRAIKAQDYSTFYSFLEFTIRRCVALMLPITLAILVLGDSCINLIYGRGDFTSESIAGTTQCLWGYGIGLVPMTLVLILAPSFYAQGKPKIPAVVSVIAMTLNAVLNAWMIMGLGMGPASVAIATSVSALVNFGLLAFVFPNFKTVASHDFWNSINKIACSSLLAAVAVVGIDYVFFGGSSAFTIFKNELPMLPKQFLDQLVKLGLQSFVFVGVLAICAFSFRVKDMNFLKIA